MMRVEGVTAQYRTIAGPVLAVEDVSFTILGNEIFGIAGESGCGKTTLLKVLYDTIAFPLELPKGQVTLRVTGEDGKEAVYKTGEIRKAWWNGISYVPQAAMSVLNPVLRVSEQFYDAIRKADPSAKKKDMRAQIIQYLKELELPEAALDAFPHQLSGGMRQRVVIALATFVNPGLVLADEPTTALDVVVQRGILLLLMRLQEKQKNTMVIVSHDMGVHYQITKRMGIMYAGNMVEMGVTDDIFDNPAHPYTEMLISALPRVGDRRLKEGISGAPPSLRNPPPGCRFAPRCPKAMEECRAEKPAFIETRPGHFAACHLLAAMKGAER